MTASAPCIFFDTLDPADRMALYWVRALMRPSEQARADTPARGADVSGDILGVQRTFANAMARLTPVKRHWLGIHSRSATHVTENELHCLDALAAVQAGQAGLMQRSLCAVFPRAWARAPFVTAFDGLGAWLAAHGYWLARPTGNTVDRALTMSSVPAPCDRCSACGPEKVTLSSYACLAALSRWRETLGEDGERAVAGSVNDR